MMIEVLAVLVFAQDDTELRLEHRPRFPRISIHDGLSASVVETIVQDSSGFIWIGTRDGLNRFDGGRLRILRADNEDVRSLRSSYVVSLAEASERYLFIGTDLGLSRLDLTTDRIWNSDLGPVRALAVTQSRVWFGTDTGLCALSLGIEELDGDVASCWPFEDLGLSGPVRSLIAASDGDLYCGASGGVAQLRANSPPELIRLIKTPDSALGEVNALFEDRPGHLWIGTSSGLWSLDVLKLHPPSFVEALPPVLSLVSDRHNTLWIGSEAGLFSRDAAGYLRRFVAHPREAQALQNDTINSLTLDMSGVLWIGTFAGAHRLDTEARLFEHWLNGYTVWAMLETSDGVLWISTSEGLLVGRENQNLEVFDLGEVGAADSLVWALAETNDGSLLIGTHDRGLLELDQNRKLSHAWQRSGRSGAELSGDAVTWIVEDHDGDLWVATADGGLSYISRTTGRTRVFRHDPNDPASLISDQVMILQFDAEENLWIGTLNGLDRLRPGSAQFEHFVHVDGDVLSLANNRVLGLSLSEDGSLWVGTAGGGVSRRDAMTGLFESYTVADGLPNNVVYSVMPDQVGAIWMSTNQGLGRLDPQTGSCRIFVEADGLQSNEFNFPSSLRGAGGARLFFGGVNGLTVVHNDRITPNPIAPPVVLTSIKLFNRELEIATPFHLLHSLELSWRDEVIHFEFAALSYNDPQHNSYAYRLEGFEELWNQAGSLYGATYTNLDPGTYVLRVKGANSDGTWNEDGVNLTIVITPPFWQTGWFRLLVLFAVTAMIVAGHRLRVRRLEKSQRLLEEQVASRTREIERITEMVRTINAETEFDDLLPTMLNEIMTLDCVSRAMILVWDPAVQRIRVRAVLPDAQRLPELRRIEVQTSLDAADKVREGLFRLQAESVMAKRLLTSAGNEVLVLALRTGATTAQGLLVLEGDDLSSEHDLDLLHRLHSHLLSAFIKNRLLEELRDLNNKKSEVLRIAAHDIRSPIATMSSFLDLMARRIRAGRFDVDDIQKKIGTLRELSSQTLKLLEQMLDLSAIESGQHTLNIEVIDLRALAAECVAYHLRAAKEKEIDLSLDGTGPTVVTVPGDATSLRQVLHNLISNAVKFTYPGGRVVTRCECVDGNATVHVQDNGQGLSSEDLKQAFRSFRRLSARPTAGEASNGLGLAIAKGIIEVHHGKIWVKSEKGKGSTFSFSLPLDGNLD